MFDSKSFLQLLIDNPLLLLFLIAAISYPLGRIKIKGSSLGVAAVLFVALAFGALDPNLKLPEIIHTVGLVVFVYTIGLSSGPGFFASFRRKEVRDNAFIVGMFTGSLTKTPASAGVLEYLKTYTPPAAREQLLAEPVIGYSIAYPMGVIGMIVAVALAPSLFMVNYTRDAEARRATNQPLPNRAIRVTRVQAKCVPLQALVQQQKWDVLFGRSKRGTA